MITIDTGSASTTLDSLLPPDLLARMDERAAGYDQENRFFDEDFAELRETGFLDVALPSEFGGHDLRLDTVSEGIGRIAYVAPATALARSVENSSRPALTFASTRSSRPGS